MGVTIQNPRGDQRHAEANRALDEVTELHNEEGQRATLAALMTAIDDELGLS
jgi:hypothetical protein